MVIEEDYFEIEEDYFEIEEDDFDPRDILVGFTQVYEEEEEVFDYSPEGINEFGRFTQFTQQSQLSQEESLIGEPDYRYQTPADDNNENIQPSGTKRMISTHYAAPRLKQTKLDFGPSTSRCNNNKVRDEYTFFDKHKQIARLSTGIHKDRVFHVGSSYKWGRTEKICTIHLFKVKNMQLLADCTVFIPIQQTKMFEDAPLDGKTRYVCIREEKRVHFLMDEPIEPSQVPEDRWYYETNTAATGLQSLFCAFKAGVSSGSTPSKFPSCVNKKIKTLDLFCGAGGFSSGLSSNENFKVVYGVDKDSHAVSNFLINHEDVVVFDEDVNEFLDKVERRTPKYPSPIDIDHVHASTPCNGATTSNRNGGKDDEKNNELCSAFPRSLKVLNATTGSYENVLGLKDKKNRKYLQLMLLMLLDFSYQFRVGVLNSADYGDPQLRQRLIILVSKRDVDLPSLPKPTHGKDPNLLPYVTVKDAIGDLATVQPSNGICVVEEKKLYNHKVSAETRSEKTVLVGDKPSPTVRTQHAFWHYELDRSLTDREYARLQSFSDDDRFFGSSCSIRRYIGNAVPCRLAAAIGNAISDSYSIFCLDDEIG